MARKRIQGITIELDGETKGLDKALKDVNKRSGDLASELREVEKALKFNPGNTDLLAQQQKLLQQQVDNSTKKLDQLKQAQSQVEQQFKSGQLGEEQYRAFQREVIKTESQLDGFKKKLNSVDDGKPLNKVEQDMKGVSGSAENAESKVKGLGSALGGLTVSSATAGSAINEALNFSELDTKIDISFDVPEESKADVKQAVKDVTAYGLDAEEALEGVRRQWALNADASDEANADIVKGASVISQAYAGIDFTELIQETNEIAAALEISNEEALGLTDSLLKSGFPPEQLDIIAEYGTQLSMAGFEAEEIQAIFAAGVDTKSWNIDNLMDGLKEGNIRMKEFGQEVPDAMKELLEGTDISAKQLQQWGEDVAKGGEDGKQAMSDVATALADVEDETKRSQIGVEIFGTMYEDQGQAITDVLINAKDATVDLKDGTDGVADSVAKMDANPAVLLKQAMNDVKTALGPLLEQIAEFISKIAEWAKENSGLLSTLLVISSIAGVIGGALMALAPVIYTIVNTFNILKTILPIVATAFGAISAPVLIVIGVIAALVAGIIALWKNWDTVSQFLIESWNWLKETASTVFTAIGEAISIAWEWIRESTAVAWEGIKQFFSDTWEWIKETFMAGLNTVQEWISTAWNFITTLTTDIWNGIKEFFVLIWESIVASITERINNVKNNITIVFNAIKTIITAIWEGIKIVSSTVWNAIVTTVTAIINAFKNVISTVFNTIKTIITTIWNTIKTVSSTIWNSIINVITTIINSIKNIISTVFNTIKTIITTIWNAIKTVSSTVWNGIKSAVSNVVNSLKSTISTVFNSMKSIISTVWNAIKSTSVSVWNGIKSTISGIWNGLKDTVSSVFNGIKDTISGVWDSVKSSTDDIWDGITDSVKGAINGVIGAINGMIDVLNGLSIKLPKIPDWVPGMGGKGGGEISFPNIPNVPTLDVGTNYVKKDGLAMIHEGEAVVPKKYNPAASGYGQGITINIESLEVREEQDIEKLAQQFYRLIENKRRGSGSRV